MTVTKRPSEPVRMLYARADGTILDHPGLALAGVGGSSPRPVRDDELIPLPRGSDLFLLPGRRPVGRRRRDGVRGGRGPRARVDDVPAPGLPRACRRADAPALRVFGGGI